MSELQPKGVDSTWKKGKVPRGKHHNKTATKTTVSLYLSKNLVEKARKHKLNLSRITERTLNSILDYLETQNNETSSEFLGEASFPEKVQWTGRDLNPRPPRCQRGDHSMLIYPPNCLQSRMRENLSISVLLLNWNKVFWLSYTGFNSQYLQMSLHMDTF